MNGRQQLILAILEGYKGVGVEKVAVSMILQRMADAKQPSNAAVVLCELNYLQCTGRVTRHDSCPERGVRWGVK